MVELIEGAPFVTCQDAEQLGVSHLGISAGGAADPVAWKLANLLVGRTSGPAFEMTLKGGTFRFLKDGVFALTGADCGGPAPWQTHPAKAGDVIRLGPCREGARAYLAVGEGRHLLKTSFRLGSRARLRVLKGVDWESFPEILRSAFTTGHFEVSPHSNRNGIRLHGPLPSNDLPAERLTEGVLWGTVQVPPSGQPLILMNDQQTTGGYPQLAQVIQADRCLLGQLRPGEKIQFEWIEAESAVEVLRKQVEATTVVPL